MNPQENRRKWHVNREISVGDAMTALGLLVLGFLAYSTVVTRVALLEQAQAAQKEEAASTYTRLESNIAEINHKLDRLIERR